MCPVRRTPRGFVYALSRPGRCAGSTLLLRRPPRRCARAARASPPPVPVTAAERVVPDHCLAHQARHQVAPRHARVEVRHEIPQQAQSPFALLVDGHLQGVAVGRHGAQRVAWWHHLGSGGGQQAGDLAGAHAGGLLDQLALALRVQQRGHRHRAGRQLHKRIIPERFRRERSGVQRLRWSHDRHGLGGADADAGRCVGGRSCGAGPSSEDGAAGPATATATGSGAQEGAGNGAAFPFNSGRGSSAPACQSPGSCVTAWLATCTPGAIIAATSPEHSPAGGASPGADRGPRSPCSPASPGAAGSSSCLVRSVES